MTREQKKRKQNTKYWRSRALRMEGAKEALSDELMKRTRKSYIRAFRRLNGQINALYAEMLSRPDGELTRTELYQLRHYKELRQKIADEIEGLAINDNRNIEALLDKVTRSVYEENLSEFGLEFSIFSEQQAKSIASQNWSGISFSDRIWGNANKFNERVMSDVEELVIAGKNPDQLKKKLMEDFSVGYREADRLIRTEASHAYNEAAIESYKEAGLAQVDFLAEADCCDICAEYSGKRFLIGDVPIIPVHPNCRCTYLPVIE